MKIRRSAFLMAAFAALLGVSAVAAWSVWRNAREAQTKTALLHERDLAAHEALSEIRANVYLTAILARDYLLNANPSTRDYLAQFAAIRRGASASLQGLQRSAQGQEFETALSSLSRELDAYWETTDAMLHWNAQTREQQREEALRRRVGRRQDILMLTERIEQLTVQSSAQDRARIAEAGRYFQVSLSWIGGVALLLGVAISGFTIYRMRALEKQSDVAESELRSLSGQIRTAQEEERKSLSRELHDQVGQMLTGLRMELTSRARADSSDGRDVRGLDRAKQTVEQTLVIVRNIAMLLRPSMLDDLGLTPALTWLTKEVSRSSGIEIQLRVDPGVDALPDAHRTCLYRVVQEALTNVSRHSGARAVDINVAAQSDLVLVKVVDDGKGFDLSEKRKGLGLLGMEERVRELGGQLHVSSVPGRGTTINISLPRPKQMEVANGKSVDSGRSRDRENGVKAAL